MNTETRRLLELAGILRRNTPDHLLFEGDDEEGGDDPFADDEGDDPFGDDEGGDDESGDEEATREAPPSLDAADFEKFGSPRFDEISTFLQQASTDAVSSAYVGAQEREDYPGEALPTPSKDDPEEEEEEEKKEESISLSRRDKSLITEAMRLLNESGEDDDLDAEDGAPDQFDMVHFTGEVARLIQNYDTLMDIEGSIFNMARTMMLNNFGKDTEREFIEFLARHHSLDFTEQFSGEPEIPVAVGATVGGGGAV